MTNDLHLSPTEGAHPLAQVILKALAFLVLPYLFLGRLPKVDDAAGGRGFDTSEIAITMTGEDGMPQRVAGRYFAVLTRVGGEWTFRLPHAAVEPQ